VARAVLNPRDDLTLATALKTPLLGLDDDDLLMLAPERPGPLIEALRASLVPAHRAATALLDAAASWAARLGPFGFVSRLLSDGRRTVMVGRLGREADEALSQLEARALEFERQSGPSLGQFLTVMGRDDEDRKRDLAVPSGEVRVMTVHGAKGLEAPIVILADAGMPEKNSSRETLLRLPHPGRNAATVPVWVPRKDLDSAALAAARARRAALATEERHRLLYVALTRAQDRLILGGVQPAQQSEAGLPNSWYGLVETGLSRHPAGLQPIELAGHPARRFQLRPGALAVPVRVATAEPAAGDPTPWPEWLHRVAPQEVAAPPPISPASALMAADRPAREADPLRLAAAAQQGRLVHLLLQHLPSVPPDRRGAVAERLAAARGPFLTAERRRTLVAETLALMDDSRLAPLFGPDSLAEVPIAGRLDLGDGAGPREVAGRIDRLAVAGDEVLLADFKTAARPPASVGALPVTALAQIALYARLARPLFPGRRIVPLLIYTAGPRVFAPDEAALAAALAGVAP
jgi:ATP-dependent helicase/nuclease subunit A